MIKELINFTENLIADIPEIMQWKVQPIKGLHVFIDIDENGKWTNQNLELGKDYDYYDGKGELSPILEETKVYQLNSQLINQDMNKCLDNDKCEYDGIIYPIKQIQSCSPYVLGFKVKEKEQDVDILINGQKSKKKKSRLEVIEKRAEKYLLKAIEVCNVNDLAKNKIIALKDNIHDIIEAFKMLKIRIGKKEITAANFSKSDFISIYIRNITKEELQRSYSAYTTSKLFLKNEYNSEIEIRDSTFGLSSFFMIDNEGKQFLKHLTGVQYNGINGRVSAKQMKSLYKFNLLLKNGNFPNPLPVYIDKTEVNLTGKIMRIFKDQGFDRYRYGEILGKIFEKDVKLSNYYLLNFHNNYIVDFDHVNLFRYYIEENIWNVTELMDNAGTVKPLQPINNIFQLEQEINKLFLKYDKKTGHGYGFLIGNYFGEKVEQEKTFNPKRYSVKYETLRSFYNFRKGIYDFIYKSRKQSLTLVMFDEIVSSAITADIFMDEFRNRKHSKYYQIREKINVWFSLNNLFNNSNNHNMVSKIEEIKKKTKAVAEDQNVHINSTEEFAFASGQIASYLIEQSEASNKTYALLEPFLQKRDSHQLQAEILRFTEMYKHKLRFYNGYKYGLELLISDVLTFGEEPFQLTNLKKYFIAGCFSPCVFKKQKTKNT